MGKAKPTIGEILTSLKHEVVVGKAYLGIAKGLGEADPVVLGASRTFFGLTVEACLHMAQMFAAKLYDETSRAVTVKSLLEAAQAQAGTFKHATTQEVFTAIKEPETRVAGLVAILKSVKDRRNQSLAHLDPRTVKDPAGLAQRAKLTFCGPRKSV
jgi:AbiU2